MSTRKVLIMIVRSVIYSITARKGRQLVERAIVGRRSTLPTLGLRTGLRGRCHPSREDHAPWHPIYMCVPGYAERGTEVKIG